MEHLTLAPWQLPNGQWRSRCQNNRCGRVITAVSFEAVQEWAEAHDALSLDLEYV